MNNANKLNEAENIIDSLNKPEREVKRINRTKDGLIERIQYENKIILTEDNKQMLFG